MSFPWASQFPFLCLLVFRCNKLHARHKVLCCNTLLWCNTLQYLVCFIPIQHTPACSVMMQCWTYPGNTLTSCNIMCLSILTLTASVQGLHYDECVWCSVCSVAVPPVTRRVVVGFSNFDIAQFVLQYSKKAPYPCWKRLIQALSL